MNLISWFTFFIAGDSRQCARQLCQDRAPKHCW